MKSEDGEIEVYLCPDATTAKQKQQTPIPPSDPLLADILSVKSPFSPARAIFNSSSRHTPSTSARRNLTFQNSPDKRSEQKDPVLNSFTPSISKSENFDGFSQPSTSQFNDIPLDSSIHLSPLHDSLKRIFDEPSTSRSGPAENIRLKHALISESDDFGPIGNRYPLTMHDLETSGRNFYFNFLIQTIRTEKKYYFLLGSILNIRFIITVFL